MKNPTTMKLLLQALLSIHLVMFSNGLDFASNANIEKLLGDDASNRLFETQLECLLDRLKVEADPMSLGERTLNLNIPGEINMESTFDNLVVSNISSMYGNHLSMVGLVASTLEIDITIPHLAVTADKYVINADVGMFQVVGEGSFLMHLYDLDLAFNMSLRVGNPASVSAVTSSISIGAVESHMENLMGGGDASDYMNLILADMIPEILDLMQDTVVEIMNDMILTMANEMLADMGLAELLNIIANACEES